MSLPTEPAKAFAGDVELLDTVMLEFLELSVRNNLRARISAVLIEPEVDGSLPPLGLSQPCLIVYINHEC